MLFTSFFFVGPHPCHVEIPKLGIKSELQLLAFTTATPELSFIGNLHGSRQRQILNPLSKASDGTHILVDTSRVLNLLSTVSMVSRVIFTVSNCFNCLIDFCPAPT